VPEVRSELKQNVGRRVRYLWLTSVANATILNRKIANITWLKVWQELVMFYVSLSNLDGAAA